MAEEIKFKKGERLTADKMNKLAKLAQSYGTMPGSFVGVGLTLTRALGLGGVDAHFVGIVESIPAASWVDTDLGEWTDVTATVHPFSAHPTVPDKTTITLANTEEIISGLPVAVTVTSGKFKKGIVLGDILIQVSCLEKDLPEDWEV